MNLNSWIYITEHQIKRLDKKKQEFTNEVFKLKAMQLAGYKFISSEGIERIRRESKIKGDVGGD